MLSPDTPRVRPGVVVAALVVVLLSVVAAHSSAQALSGTGQIKLDDAFLNATHTCGCPDPPTLVVLPITLPDTQVGVPYSEVITATGGNGLYLFRVTEGALPPGLRLAPIDVTSAGLTGIPTTSGHFVFVVSGYDENGCSSPGVYLVTVARATNIPMLSGWAMVLLAVALAVLASAAIRRQLSIQVAAGPESSFRAPGTSSSDRRRVDTDRE